MAIVAFVMHQLAIRRILDHLGLSPPAQTSRLRETSVEPVDDEGSQPVSR